MRRSFFYLSAFIILAVLLGACQTSSAEEILQNTLQKISSNKTTSFSYTLTVDESASQYLLSILGDGYQEGNERIYLKLSSPETASESIEMILVKPEQTIYSRLGDASGWSLEPASDNGTIYFTFALWLLESEKDIQILFHNPKLLGTVEKNGTRCHHLQFDLDSKQFFEILAPGQLETWGDLTFKTIRADIYISRTSGNLVNAEFSVAWYESNQENATSIICDISFSNFNEDVTFPEY